MGTLKFQKTESWMWGIGIKSPIGIMVFGIIYELSKCESGFCTTSLSNIADSFFISKRTVIRCINNLEKEGLIRKDSTLSPKGGNVNRYCVNTEVVEKRREELVTRCHLDAVDDDSQWCHDVTTTSDTMSPINKYIKENETEDKQNIEQKSAREEEPFDDLPDFGDEPSFDYLFTVDETPKPVDEVLTEIMKEKGNYFDDYRLNDMYSEFLRYRKKVIKKPIKDPMAYRKNLYRLAGDPIDVDKAVRIIEQTIDNEWRGFFALKEDKKTYEASRFERERAMDMAWLAKMKKQEQEAYAI